MTNQNTIIPYTARRIVKLVRHNKDLRTTHVVNAIGPLQSEVGRVKAGRSQLSAVGVAHSGFQRNGGRSRTIWAELSKAEGEVCQF